MLVYVLMFNFSFVSAKVNIDESIQSKKDLVEYADAYMKSLNSKNRIQSVKGKSKGELLEVLRDYSDGHSQYSEEDLNNMGIFIYNPKESKENEAIQSSGASNVRFDRIYLAYIEVYEEWWITGTVRWQNENYKENIDPLCRLSGTYDVDIGGADVAGITLYDTFNEPSDLNVLPSSGIYVTNGDDTDFDLARVEKYSTLENYDVENGVYYSFQDSYHFKKSIFGKVSEENYFGHKIRYQIGYDENFTDYNGKLVAFYSHSWDETSITGVSFGLKSLSIKVSISSRVKYWTVYSSHVAF